MTNKQQVYGFVPIPNELFDTVLPQLTDTEVRVLLIVFRKTFGFQELNDRGEVGPKRSDWISHSQLMQMTGRKSAAVSLAIASLVQAGYLIVEDMKSKPLATSVERRRHLGRLYFCPGEMWKTHHPLHPRKAKTTRNNLYKNRKINKLNRRPTAPKGWQRATSSD